MNCPECGGKSAIMETREAGYGTRRRHKCLSCYHGFSTVEITMIEYKYLANIVKKLEKTFKECPTEKGGVKQ